MRPVGYWLKELDRLIEESFEALLAEELLTRQHWQVLNTVAERPVSQAELDGELAPFLPAGAPTTAPVVEDLAGLGWVTRGRAITLTGQGHTAHADLRERVQANRLRVTAGITADEYATVVELLERMATNLRT